MNTEEIETILKHAPRPDAPPGLKERLVEQVDLRPAHRRPQDSVARTGFAGWLRRWWPALTPATVSLACALVFTMQQMEIHDLRQSLAALPPPFAKSELTPATTTREVVAPSAHAESEDQEIARLKQLAAQLASEIAQVEQVRAQNNGLRAQLSRLPTRLTPEETAAMEEARKNAETIACVNNLKQLGLAMRVWGVDNNDASPPDILSMTNEINTPKILLCPSDTARQAAGTWATYSPANCSYEYLAPAEPQAGREPQLVAFRCPIHGSVTLCDGSVQKGVAKEHPDWLVQRNGKLYCEGPGASNTAPTNPSDATEPTQTPK